jgi:glycosyltransferase involved in cell wall biosynthesis
LVTVDQSIGSHWNDDVPERIRAVNIHLSKVLARLRQDDIDVIHTHDAKATSFLHNSLSAKHIPVVMTLHVPPQESLFSEDYPGWGSSVSASQVHCAAISEYQRKQYSGLVDVENVVYHGIDVSKYSVKGAQDKDDYLFNIGRITRDKGQDKAIEIAKKTGSKLIIAGCVQDKVADQQFFKDLKNSIDLSVDVEKRTVDSNYHDKVIKPLLESDKQIIYIGEISSEHKKQWFQYARATLFPIQWGEPFGLVMIESMASGTPVIALNEGAVPEVMVDGKTGFVVDSMNAMIEAVARVDGINPRACRKHVEGHFSIISMAKSYFKLYERILDSKELSPQRRDRPTNNYLPVPWLNDAGTAQQIDIDA